MSLPKKTTPAQVCHVLNSKEINDPQLVLEEIFDFADIDDLRQLLWEWLKTAVTGNYHRELSAIERATILSMYEKMEKLLEAAYLLHEGSKRQAKT